MKVLPINLLIVYGCFNFFVIKTIPAIPPQINTKIIKKGKVSCQKIPEILAPYLRKELRTNTNVPINVTTINPKNTNNTRRPNFPEEDIGLIFAYPSSTGGISV